MANQHAAAHAKPRVLTRFRNAWRRWLKWPATCLLVVTGLWLIFASNRMIYLSHQRFSYGSQVQWKYQLNSDNVRPRPLIIGHRGSGVDSTDPKAKFKHKLIGNTLTAIEQAIDAADWIEIDIRKSKQADGEDSELVVFHDANVAAKTDFKGSKGAMSDLTLADLKSLNLHVASDRKIRTLNEVFDSGEIPSREIHWIFDIKASGIQEDVMRWIEEQDLPKDQLILFGDYEVLHDYKDAGYPLGYTTLASTNWRKMLFRPSAVFDDCDKLGAKLVAVPIAFVTKNFVDIATQRGVEVWCYDSNVDVDLKYAVGCGVRGVIVDHPKDVRGMFYPDERDN